MQDTDEVALSTTKTQKFRAQTIHINIKYLHFVDQIKQHNIDARGSKSVTFAKTISTKSNFLPAYEICTRILRVNLNPANSPMPKQK